MIAGWICISDSTKLQTWAIIISGFMLIWYSWETRLLRVIASDQKDQQIQPLVVYENKNAGHYIKNIGSGVALNISIDKIMIGSSQDTWIIFPKPTLVLSPDQESQIDGDFFLKGNKLSDINGTAHLNTGFAVQTSTLVIRYQNIQGRKYLTKQKISQGKTQILETKLDSDNE